ncbi:hypothetical protein M2164_003940 [Streptomyces sp. SAI-208]|uniref:hypothetical protein n=1 Tax=Streptomyces sp. SAI-208 TaxID=2940550 RepID=UPI00247620BE|nr:hypothetical protein [Streptomyces sp. SAI-208]MDH6608305.1 hypothetical protein [Streptomyces sp. SAI-208]
MASQEDDSIGKRCRQEGGLIEVTLGDLREELGYKKLGKWVLVEVAEALGKAKLGYFPPDMLDPHHNTEPRQWQTVWIYDRDGSPRAQVIDAVLHPDQHDVRGALDGLAAGRPDAMTPEQKLAQIRELVRE